MSYQNFIPTVWAEGINRDLEKAHVFIENCNREYEGKVKSKGDSVKILNVGSPTITRTTDKNIVLTDPETVEDSSITMNINQIAYYNYKIDDIDKRQAAGNVVEALQKETSEKLSDEMDRFVADMSKDKAAKLYTASNAPTQITKDNILQTLDGTLQRLYENNVSPKSKITITVPPWFYFVLKQAYVKLDTDNSEMLKNGRVGMYGSLIVKMSNNVAQYQANGKLCSMIQVKTDRAIAFVHPMTHCEAYRPEKGFSDAVKGFVLFDGKIVRPKEMIVLNCYQ